MKWPFSRPTRAGMSGVVVRRFWFVRGTPFEAVEYDGTNSDAILKWVSESAFRGSHLMMFCGQFVAKGSNRYEIIRPGYWVRRDGRIESPNLFRNCYEPVEAV